MVYPGERGSPGNVGSHLEAIHPLIRQVSVPLREDRNNLDFRTNPVTGWKSVFVARNHTKRILGVTKDESDLILDYLCGLIQLNHDLQVRFKWEKGRRALPSRTYPQ